MLAKSKKEFIDFFREIKDIREDEKVLYPLHEIMFLVFVSVLSGAESWRGIVNFGKLKIDFLKKYFSYSNGIPSKSSISRIFSLIDKANIELWLENNAMYLVKNLLTKEQLAIDGKSLRGKQKMEALSQGSHIVNLFATKLGLVLSQKTVPNKGNELAAMIEIIENSNLENTTVSIDAAGCQKEVVKKIINKKGNYFLALKENHPKLYTDVENLFKSDKEFSICETDDIGHGRIEKRICKTIGDIAELKNKYPEWQDLTSISMIERHRAIKDKTTIELKYYISNELPNAQQHLNYARNHWAIENNLHWVLDVIFKEDYSLIRKNNAAENMSAVRKMIFNVIKKYKEKTSSKLGLNIIRMSAGWNDNVLADIIDSWVYG